MILLWLPPLYLLWMYAIGDKYISDKTTKTVFKVLAILTLCLFTLPIFIIPIILGKDFNLIELNNTLKPIPMIGNVVWLFTVAILTKHTVDRDRKSRPDRYFSRADNMDYIRRFFAFVYWPFFIWTLQRTLQQHEKE